MTRSIEGLGAIAAGYDLLICDVWGVVHNGVRAWPLACEALQRFRAGGGSVILLTNAPRPNTAVTVQLEQLAVPPDTRDAIVTFERANGLEVDGEVSLALLDEIRALTNRTEISATQAKFEEPQSRPEPLPAVAKEAPTVTPVSVVSVPESEEDIARSARIARIQIGLMNFGEAGIAVDGVLGPHTVEAIRSFQERYGLQVSGEPDEAVIHKLEQIGALHNS